MDTVVLECLFLDGERRARRLFPNRRDQCIRLNIAHGDGTVVCPLHHGSGAGLGTMHFPLYKLVERFDRRAIGHELTMYH